MIMIVVVVVVELGSWHKLNVELLSSTTPYYYQVPIEVVVITVQYVESRAG